MWWCRIYCNESKSSVIVYISCNSCLIWKDNNQKVLNLTKIYKMDRNCFWKIVKKYKAKKHKNQ
jgi:hypothetical protein